MVRIHGRVQDLLTADVADAPYMSTLLAPFASSCELFFAYQALLIGPEPGSHVAGFRCKQLVFVLATPSGTLHQPGWSAELDRA